MCLVNLAIITVDNFGSKFDIKSPIFVAHLGILTSSKLEIPTNKEINNY